MEYVIRSFLPKIFLDSNIFAYTEADILKGNIFSES